MMQANPKIDSLVRSAVDRIRREWGLPATGFVAGGAVANIVWEMVSGNPAVVNDVDVFVSGQSDGTSIFRYEKKDVVYCKSYSQLTQHLEVSGKYQISSVTRDGMLNIVRTTECDPTTILESFDINATRVGYSIDEDRVYALADFAEFLDTGRLIVSNLTTPAHTAIRLAKKTAELNAEIGPMEFDILGFTLWCKPCADPGRFRFMRKYLDLYTRHEKLLAGRFGLERCADLERYFSENMGMDEQVYQLTPVAVSPVWEEWKSALKTRYILLNTDVLLFLRHVVGNPSLVPIWSSLMPFYKGPGYLDPSDPDTAEMARQVAALISAHPQTIGGLTGLTLAQQHELIHNVLTTVGRMFGMETAVKVIETRRIRPGDEIGEFEARLLGLSVRRLVGGGDILPF